MNKVYTALFFVLTLLMGCGDEEMASQIDDPVDNAEQITAGAMVYMEPQPTGNTFACVHCHAIAEPSVDNFVRPGHPIGDALRRETFKNGQLTDFLDAANSCLDEWMAVDAPWTESTAELLALNA